MRVRLARAAQAARARLGGANRSFAAATTAGHGRREHRQLFLQFDGPAAGTRGALPVAGAHEEFGVLLAVVAVKFVNRHGRKLARRRERLKLAGVHPVTVGERCPSDARRTRRKRAASSGEARATSGGRGVRPSSAAATSARTGVLGSASVSPRSTLLRPGTGALRAERATRLRPRSLGLRIAAPRGLLLRSGLGALPAPLR